MPSNTRSKRTATNKTKKKPTKVAFGGNGRKKEKKGRG